MPEHDGHPAPAPPPPPPPAPPPTRAYRAARFDVRLRIILLALAAWLVLHIFLGVRTHYLVASGQAFVDPPTGAIALDPSSLQLHVPILGRLGSSFLHSAAWQLLGIFLFVAGLVVVLNARLRIVALVIPTVLFLSAALVQAISYNIFNPYEVQGHPLLTLAFLVVCFVSTVAIAPRNSGWRDLGVMARDLARDTLTNPVALVFGPIFGKDVRVMGRRRSTYVIRALYPLCLLLLMTPVYYAAAADISINAGAADRLQKLQQIAPMLALCITWVQYVVLLFMAASICSSAVCDERRTRTLASLMTTPMSAPQIITGKLAGRLIQLLIVGLISVPFLLAVRVFGGLEPEAIFAILAITVTSVLLMASLGIMTSVWNRRAASAAALTLVLFFVITIVPVIVMVLIAISGRAGAPPDEIFAFSAPISLMAVSSMLAGGGGPRLSLTDLWIVNSIVNTGLAGVALFIASASLRAVMLSDTALDAPTPRRRRAGKRSTAPAAHDVPPITPPTDHPPEGAPAAPTAVVYAERDTTVSDNPILWRELRQPAVGSRRALIVAFLTVLALLVWLYSELAPSRAEPHMIAVVIGMLLLMIQAAVVSTSSVTNEKEGSTWPTLLTTPLTAPQILFPKLAGAIKRLWFVPALIGAELLIGLLAGGVRPVLLVHMAMIALSLGVFLGGTGVLMSTLMRRGSAAGVANMLLAGALWLGLPFAGILFMELIWRSGRSNDELMQVLLCINPMALAVAATEGGTERSGDWSCFFAGGGHWTLSEFTALLVGVCAVANTLGVAAVALACRRFNAMTGRTS